MNGKGTEMILHAERVNGRLAESSLAQRKAGTIPGSKDADCFVILWQASLRMREPVPVPPHEYRSVNHDIQ